MIFKAIRILLITAWLIAGTVFQIKSQPGKQCGFVFDSISGEPIIGAFVVGSGNSYCVTDNNGFFCLPIRHNEEFTCFISFVGYEKKEIICKGLTSKLLKIYLSPGTVISEVIINGNLAKYHKPGTVDIPLPKVARMPSLTGEPDLLKAYQLMPGIQTGDEGSSGIYVRGGSPDQNLYLLDDVPLYYINHLGGFISVFDVKTIKKVTLYKSDFPARYGGRLSAILDVRLKDGNAQKHEYDVSIGTLATRIFSEGPLVKNKMTYMVSYRRSNTDLFMRPIASARSGGNKITSYGFYDLNTKITWKLADKDKVSVLLYTGRDKLLFLEKYAEGEQNQGHSNDRYVIRWGNIVGSLNWNHLLNDHTILETKVGYTRFQYEVENKYSYSSEEERFNTYNIFTSGIHDYSAAASLNIIGKNIQIVTGAGSMVHLYNPNAQKNSIQSPDYSQVNSFYDQSIQPEFKAFCEVDCFTTQKLSVSTGVHYISWPLINKQTIDPRLSLKYSLSERFVLRTSFSMMHQYVHLLTTNGSGIPSDLWVPSTKKLSPERTNQIALGFEYAGAIFGISADLYYKAMKNLIMYKPGSSLNNTRDWEQTIENQGKGNAKGIELLIQKKAGNIQGWIGYTLSKNTREFNQVNHGKPFPFKYDRRHEFKVVLDEKLTEHISVSADWVFATGSTITLPAKKYVTIDFDTYGENYHNQVLLDAHYYNGINSYRTIPYHRLDFAVTFSKTHHNYKRELSLGVYNVYNRKNPYYYFFDQKEGKTKLYSYTLFPIIPSFNCRFSF